MFPSVDAALANPWGTLRLVVGDPLHPGGDAATEALLDRTAVTADTRLLDVGCGTGGALSLARERGADAVGIDLDPAGERTLRGDLGHLPVKTGGADVVLAECVLCLADDLDGALGEARRVLPDDGRLALSDVVVEGDLPAGMDRLAEALCLTGQRERAHLRDRLAAAGFEVGEVRDHRQDLLAMRDRARRRVDYEGLLGALGADGEALLEAVRELERAIETGDVGYVSLVATPA
jgi:SAM-dependent methyltransferase